MILNWSAFLNSENTGSKRDANKQNVLCKLFIDFTMPDILCIRYVTQISFQMREHFSDKKCPVLLYTWTASIPVSNQRATSPNPKLLKSRLGKILEIANTYLSKTFIEFKPLWPWQRERKMWSCILVIFFNQGSKWKIIGLHIFINCSHLADFLGFL